MIKGIVTVVLKSGNRVTGTLVNMQRGLITLEYPFYLSEEDKVVVPDDIQIKLMNVPIETMVAFDTASFEIVQQYMFYSSAILAGNMLKNVYPGIKMSSVDQSANYKFFNCINQQHPETN
jgi:hypothetical protein